MPRLTAKLGEKDLEKWREEDREAIMKEATIEEKIRMRKKEKAKKRAELSRRMEQGQPKRKRTKYEEGIKVQSEGKETRAEVLTSPAKKRRVGKT